MLWGSGGFAIASLIWSTLDACWPRCHNRRPRRHGQRRRRLQHLPAGTRIVQLGYGGNSGDVGGGGATGIRSKGATRTSGLRNKGTAISGEIDLERGRCGEYWPGAAAYFGLARGN